MEILVNIFTPVLIFVATLMGMQTTPATDAQMSIQGHNSVELGLLEMSPNGEQGGFAIPASGCSPSNPNWHGYPIHDCDILPDISVDKPIVRLNDRVIVTWDPKIHQNCVLSANLMALTPTPSGAVAGSRPDYPTGETSYSIVCDGVGYSDSVTVKVLPIIQET